MCICEANRQRENTHLFVCLAVIRLHSHSAMYGQCLALHHEVAS